MQVDGYSLDAQRDKLRKYAEYEDMTIVGEYYDEGYSGNAVVKAPLQMPLWIEVELKMDELDLTENRAHSN